MRGSSEGRAHQSTGIPPPPHDPEVEKSVLGFLFLLRAKEFRNAVARLNPSHFYTSEHARTLLVLKQIAQEGHDPDPALFRPRAPDLEALARECADYVPSLVDRKVYEKRLLAAYRARSVYDVALSTLARIGDRSGWEGATEILLAELAKREDAWGTQRTSIRVHPLPDLLARPTEPVHWLVDRVLEKATVSLWFGATYTGKSTISWWVTLRLALGQGAVLQRPVLCDPQRTLLVLGENPVRDARRTLELQLEDMPPPAGFFILDAIEERLGSLAEPSGRRAVEELIETHSIDVVVLDNLMSLARTDIADAEIATSVMLWLKELARTRGTTFLIVHHVRKAGSRGDEGSPMDRLYGAQEWGSFTDSAYFLDFEEGGGPDSPRRILHSCKCRNAGVLRAPIIVEIDEDSLVPEFVAAAPMPGKRRHAETETRKADPERAIRILEESGKAYTRAELAQALEVSPRSIRRLVSDDPLFRQWMEAGRIEVVARNRKGAPEAFQAARRSASPS